MICSLEPPVQACRWPIVSTSRLVLRLLEECDISPAYVAWLNDPMITRHLEIRHSDQTYESMAVYLRQRNQNIETGCHFGVFDQQGARHIGTVTLNDINKAHLTADISFVIGHPEAQGHGYATEAVYAVCSYAFRARGLFKITGGHYASNTGSFRVFQKNGFQFEGRRRAQVVNVNGEREDVLLHGLLAEELEELDMHLDISSRIIR